MGLFGHIETKAGRRSVQSFQLWHHSEAQICRGPRRSFPGDDLNGERYSIEHCHDSFD